MDVSVLLRHMVEVGASALHLNSGNVPFDPAVEIRDLNAEGGSYGMHTFDQALVHLVEAGIVTEDHARLVSANPHDLVPALRGSFTRA